MTDSPNFDTAKIIFPDLPSSWFVDADSADMFYALEVAKKFKAKGLEGEEGKTRGKFLSNRLLYDLDHGKLRTIYTEELVDELRATKAKEYIALEPAIKKWQVGLLGLSPFMPECERLVKEGAIKFAAYKALEGVVRRWPSEAFDKKCIEALQIMSSVNGWGSSKYLGAKKKLEGYIERIDEGIRELGGLGGDIEVKAFSEKTLQAKKEALKEDFFREGKMAEEWKAVIYDAFKLWCQFPEGEDKELVRAIHDDSLVEYEKLTGGKKRSITADIMKSRGGRG